jgi:hypothetical protein
MIIDQLNRIDRDASDVRSDIYSLEALSEAREWGLDRIGRILGIHGNPARGLSFDLVKDEISEIISTLATLAYLEKSERDRALEKLDMIEQVAGEARARLDAPQEGARAAA